MKDALRSFRRATGGMVGVFMALSLPVTLGFVALGTDYGFLLADRQRLQGIADLAALSGAASIGSEDSVVRQVVRDNREDPVFVDVRVGAVATDGSGGTRFEPGASGGAVEVRIERPSQIFFAKLFLDRAPAIAVRAVAMVEPVVSLGAGSRLAMLGGGVPAQLSRAVLGTAVDLSVLGHDGLARSTIRASGLVDELAKGLTPPVRTVGELLDREVEVGVLVAATARALGAESKPGPAADVARLVSGLAGTRARVSLGQLLAVPADVRDMTLASPSTYLGAQISAAGLVSAALQPRAAGTDAVSTGLTVPGLLSSHAEILLGEAFRHTPPQALGGTAVGVATAQLRGRLGIETGALFQLLSAKLDVPLDLVVAAGKARVVQASCSAEAAHRSVTVEVRPGLARLELARDPRPLSAIGLPASNAAARILDVTLLRIDAHALARMQDTAPRRIVFRGAEIGNGTVKSVVTRDLVAPLVADLLGSVTIRANLLGLGIGLGRTAVEDVAKVALLAVAKPIDDLVAGLLDAAGVRLGTVDVRVDDLVCGAARIAS